MSGTVILWLRRDLRLADNPALAAAAACGPVLPVYIHAPHEEAPWGPGAASRWWLHRSLAALGESVAQRGGRLVVSHGDSLAVLGDLAAAEGVRRIYWNRLYDPATRARDTRIKAALRERGLACESFNGSLLAEPWETGSSSDRPLRVYRAFARRLFEKLGAMPQTDTSGAVFCAPKAYRGSALADLDAVPKIPRDGGLAAAWEPGERPALARARAFADHGLAEYGERRDIPGVPGTSRLSAHLHFGEIAPWRLVALARARRGAPQDPAEDPFLRELGWREFAYHLLYGFPQTPEEPLDARFAGFPWRQGEAAERDLAAWQQGRTGIPLVDAGMRELSETGWMHNRVRMAVASFLTKNLLIPWQAGARWFWDTLVDADLANNTLNWQWTAGCGADAAPYFRVFNPVRQGERFDADGAYVRRHCPELAGLPDRYIHKPWAAPASVLSAAGVTLGQDYPHPIVDLAGSRQAALDAFRRMRQAGPGSEDRA